MRFIFKTPIWWSRIQIEWSSSRDCFTSPSRSSVNRKRDFRDEKSSALFGAVMDDGRSATEYNFQSAHYWWHIVILKPAAHYDMRVWQSFKVEGIIKNLFVEFSALLFSAQDSDHIWSKYVSPLHSTAVVSSSCRRRTKCEQKYLLNDTSARSDGVRKEILCHSFFS